MNKVFVVLLAVVIVSGCVGQDSDIFKALTSMQLSKPADLVSVNVQTPDSVFSGKDFKWWLDITPQYDIDNVAFVIYDKCIFTVGKLAPGADAFTWPKLESNRTYTYVISYAAPAVTTETTCNVKARLSYDNWQNVSQTLNVLPENEWFERDKAGTLSELGLTKHETKSDLKVTLTWEENPPFINGRDYVLHIDYEDTGTGIMEDIKKGDIVITMPENLDIDSLIPATGQASGWADCDDYSYADYSTDRYTGKLTLNRDLTFTDRKAKRSTCTFISRSTDGNLLDTGTMFLNAKYSYKLYSDFDLKIEP